MASHLSLYHSVRVYIGYLFFSGKTVIKLSPERSDLPLRNFPNIQKDKCNFIRQKKHKVGNSILTFLYKFNSSSEIVKFCLQCSQILISFCIFVMPKVLFNILVKESLWHLCTHKYLPE